MIRTTRDGPSKWLMLLLFCVCVDSYKILGIFPYTGRSHFNFFKPLLKELTARGHELTVISQFPQKTTLNGYKDVVLHADDNTGTGIFDMMELPPKWIRRFTTMFILKDFAEFTCSRLSQKPVLELLHSNNTFDLILVELFNTDCFLGFVHKFKAPHVALSSCMMMPWHHDRYGNPSNPSYIPMHFGYYQNPMTFFDRLENTIHLLASNFMYWYIMDASANTVAKKYFGDDMPPLPKIAENTSLFIVNVHHVLNSPEPKVPSLIEVGGMFLGKNKRLPQVNI